MMPRLWGKNVSPSRCYLFLLNHHGYDKRRAQGMRATPSNPCRGDERPNGGSPIRQAYCRTVRSTPYSICTPYFRLFSIIIMTTTQAPVYSSFFFFFFSFSFPETFRPFWKNQCVCPILPRGDFPSWPSFYHPLLAGEISLCMIQRRPTHPLVIGLDQAACFYHIIG